MNRYPLTPCRLSPTFLQAVNPVWWLSDTTPHPGWTWAQWFLRNPFSNLFSVGIGVAHRFRTFYSPDTATIWSPTGKPRVAWTWAIPWLLPLVSWQIKTREIALGWKPDGSFSLTYRALHAQEAHT